MGSRMKTVQLTANFDPAGRPLVLAHDRIESPRLEMAEFVGVSSRLAGEDSRDKGGQRTGRGDAER